MKRLGFDLGNKTLGVAISDDMGVFARGLDTIRFADRDFAEALQKAVELIQTNDVAEVVLGHPKNMNGTVGEQGKIAEQFAADLKQRVTIPVVLWDERLTSKMAQSMMTAQNLRRKQKKADKDKMAAVIILQSYLDQRK